MQWAWHFSEEAGSLAAGAGDISFEVTTGKMVSAAAGDTVRSSRPSRITMQLAFAVAIVVFSVSGLDMMSFGCDEIVGMRRKRDEEVYIQLQCLCFAWFGMAFYFRRIEADEKTAMAEISRTISCHWFAGFSAFSSLYIHGSATYNIPSTTHQKKTSFRVFFASFRADKLLELTKEF